MSNEADFEGIVSNEVTQIKGLLADRDLVIYVQANTAGLQAKINRVHEQSYETLG